MTVQIDRTPTFTLFGVNPSIVAKDYNSGKFVSATTPVLKKTIRLTDAGTLRPIYGTTHLDPIFCYHNKSGHESIFITTCNNVKYGQQDGDTNISCEWCRCMCDGEVLGIPVKCRTDVIDGRTVMMFGLQGTFCDFACTLAHIQHTRDGSSCSESYLRSMFELSHPGENLEAAPHYRLLSCNGGGLNREQFRNKKYSFSRIGSYDIYPVKDCYIAHNK
jgi:hypothetical protein